MALPSKSYLDSIEQLYGGHRVTYPSGSAAHPRVERVYTVPKSVVASQPATLADFAGSALVEFHELARDKVHVKFYALYDTLPGPWLPFTRYDDDLGPVQGRRRAVLNTGQAASLSATARTTYETRDGSSIVSWEIQELWTDGTGGAGNPVFPTPPPTELYDDERGAVQRSTQIVVATGSEVATLVLSGATVTRTTYEPYNQFLLKKIIETFSVAGPVRVTDSLGQDNLTPAKFRGMTKTVITRTRVAHNYTFPTALIGDQTKVELARINAAEAELTITEEIIDVDADPLLGQQMGEYGIETTLESLVEDGTGAESDALVKSSRVVPLGNGKSISETVLYPAEFPVLIDYDQDPEMGSLITTTFQVVDANSVGAPDIEPGVITRYKHIDLWRSMMIVEYYSVPADYSENRFAAHSFPSLFESFFHDDNCGTIMQAREGFSAMVPNRVDITFGDYEDITGLTLIPNTFSFSSFRVSDILNDSFTLTGSGACTFSETFPDSSPSKTTYLAYGSTKQLIAGECVLWRAGIYKKSKLYLKML